MKKFRKTRNMISIAAVFLLLGGVICVSAQSNEEKISEAETLENETSDTEPDSESKGSRVLVAYFSATNNTEDVAEKLAEDLEADLYEIVPEQPYTDDDLNYSDSSTRATQEQNDPDVRPEISGSVENMEQYEIVFLGYPIWWGQAPRIMSTFIESYDFENKIIIPFCTSGSSGFGDSDSALREAADTAAWMEGKRFASGTSAEEILEWAEGLDLDLEAE